MHSRLFLIKNGIFSVFAMLMIVFSIPTAFAAVTVDLKNSVFNDLSTDDANFNAIYFLKNTGVIEGYTSADSDIAAYKPDNAINRAEFLKILYEGNDLATHETYDDCFPDVPADAWFNTYVCQAKEEGVVSGYPDGSFKPEQTINKVEAAKIIAEVSDWDLVEDTSDAWYGKYLDTGAEMNVFSASSADAAMTRGDIAEFIFRDVQIDTLKVDSYDQDYDAALFAIEDIPLTGPLAPGGLLGPLGPFGVEGAFSDDGILATDGATILDEDFFAANYCYFSDQGEFSGDALEFLQTFTQENFDTYMTGSDADDFGKMFCYPEAQETNLVLFTEELRSEYDVLCWQDPSLPTTSTDGAEEILCYVDSDAGVGIDFPYYVEVAVTEMDRVDAAFDDTQVPLLTVRVGSIGTETVTLEGIKLHSFASLPYSGIDRITIMDEEDVTVFDERIYAWEWNDDVMTVAFTEPLSIAPGTGKILSVYADLDWEDEDGDILLGFLDEKDFLTEAIVDLGVNLNGALLSLAFPLEEEAVDWPFCMFNSDKSAESGDGTMNIGHATLDEDSHAVIPIDRSGESCMSNAVYSSLRWMEEFLERDDLIENGEAGLQRIIDVLNPDGGFFFGWVSQLNALHNFIRNDPVLNACLSVSSNSSYGMKVTCEELKKNFDEDCDIPLGLTCRGKTSGSKLGHSVDVVDVTIDPEDSNKCQIVIANSWAAEDGQLSPSTSLDGFGPGTYEVAEYDYSAGSFDILTIWGNAFNCSLDSASYICPTYELECLSDAEINASISIDGDEE